MKILLIALECCSTMFNMLIIVPRFLPAGSAYLTFANIFLGMILMVVINSLITGIRSRDKNYLLMALFFTGTLMNAVCNLYSTFILPTIEPYIGSWISLTVFLIFSDSYLSLPENKYRTSAVRLMTSAGIVFFILAIIHHINDPHHTNGLITAMDISSAVIILVLAVFLISERIRGNKKAGSLLIFEGLMILGAIAAMGIFKDAVLKLGIIPEPLLQGNFLFLIGMTFNGLLFSYLLSGEMINLKVENALSEEKTRELQEVNRAKTDFMMNISHELRTPVTIIGGIVDQLKKGRWGDSIRGAAEQLSTIERNNLRLMKLISNLLELSKMDMHRVELSLQRVNVAERLKIFAAEFQSLTEQHGQSLILNTSSAGASVVSSDLHLFDTAVLNILSNAVKFTPEGGRIEVSLTCKDEYLRITVSDTGPGLTPSQQSEIFERFQQAGCEQTPSWRGAGIGLALVREIMTLHKGFAGVESAPGCGSSFYLDFPTAEDEVLTGPADTADDASALTAVLLSEYKADLDEVNDGIKSEPAVDYTGEISETGEKPVVLLVEDNQDLMKYIVTELSFQFNILSAGNGVEALEILQNEAADLIISDIMMPIMDGHRFHSELQNNSKTASIPFLFLTARDSDEEKLNALKSGAVDYIKKPFSSDELSAKIYAVISTGKAGREVFRNNFKESLIVFIDSFEDKAPKENNSSFKTLCASRGLTARETEVARLIRKGLSDKEIAGMLNISVKTVSNYNTVIFRKLEVSGRIELLTVGRQ